MLPGGPFEAVTEALVESDQRAVAVRSRVYAQFAALLGYRLVAPLNGPDAGFSLEPAEMTEVVRSCELAWSALGDGSAKRPRAEDGSRRFRRSLYAATDIAEGQELTRSNVRSIRPGFGLPPRELPNVLGKAAKVKIARGTPLAWELIG